MQGESAESQCRSSNGSLVVNVRSKTPLAKSVLAVNFLKVVQGRKLDVATEDEALEEVRQRLIQLIRSVLASRHGKHLKMWQA